MIAKDAIITKKTFNIISPPSIYLTTYLHESPIKKIPYAYLVKN
ncbi:hypothetical protein bcgnr5393_17190 [Bacillus cereus]